MIDFDTHVCIVSNEPLPNLIPALSSPIGRNHIVLLESAAMKSKADILANFLTRKGRTVSRYPIDEKGNLAVFRDQIQKVLLEYPTAALNATGGLKIMSIIAHEVFHQAGRPVFYSERDNRIIWVNPIEETQILLPGILGIDDYFAAFGQSIARKNSAPLTDDGGDAMLAKLQKLPKPTARDHDRIGERFESLVFRATKKALDLLNKTGHQEIAWGVNTKSDISDEFDVILVRNNKLFLIECKNANNKADFNIFLNKLDNLRSKRGITARAALITTATVAKDGGNAKRAHDNHILLLTYDDLPNIVGRIKDWLQSA